jgi:hypothetical protein
VKPPAFKAQEGAAFLRHLVDGRINALVCGGNRRSRRQAIRHAALHAHRDGTLQEIHVGPNLSGKLEMLGAHASRIALYDVHKLTNEELWAIRSVIQFQRGTTYILEGAHGKALIDKVASAKAAFYSQLTVVDLDRKPPRPAPAPHNQGATRQHSD